MTVIEGQQAKYLIKSLQHHPSPYLIYEKNSGIEWINKSAEYVFDSKDLSEISIASLASHVKTKKTQEIATSFLI